LFNPIRRYAYDKKQILSLRELAKALHHKAPAIIFGQVGRSKECPSKSVIQLYATQV